MGREGALESVYCLPGRKLLGLDLYRGIPWLIFINISVDNLDFQFDYGHQSRSDRVVRGVHG